MPVTTTLRPLNGETCVAPWTSRMWTIGPIVRNDTTALAVGGGAGAAGLVPVGRAAYVDFPQIGLIEVIRARLRL